MGLDKGLVGYNYTYLTVNNFPYGVGSGGTSSTITVGGSAYTLLSFTSTGTFTVSTAGLFDFLLVGGGGGGGSRSSPININGGGGGGGSVLIQNGIYLGTGTYAVTIGAAGAARANGSITKIESIGLAKDLQVVGGGAAIDADQANTSQRPGNTGGREGVNTVAAVASNFYGFAGGSSSNASYGTSYGGAGGGGDQAVGGTGTGSVGGAGGAGYDASTWRGQTAGTTYYGGGGGGGRASGSGGAGGAGGGGAGCSTATTGTAGTANTGGGGGGSFGATAVAGGSGLVLVRFKN
jgi:hypothetical protein